MAHLDHIDVIVCRLYDIAPEILYSVRRKGRVVLARFMAIRLRYDKHPDIDVLAARYNKSGGTIRHALKQAENLLKFNKDFREKYYVAQLSIGFNRLPYAPDLIRPGRTVWTRADSSGDVIMGTVTDVDDSTFTVESFEDPAYKTINRLDTGRLCADHESSLDIAYVEVV